MKDYLVRMTIVLSSTVFTWSQVAMAAEIFPFFRGVRAQGMGGVGLTTVNDETALFVNPAGLGKIRGPYLVIANPEVEGNYDTNRILMDGYQYSILLNQPQRVLDKAKANPDTHLHAKAQLLPAFVTTNFALGVYGKYSWDAEYFSATDKYRVDYTNDYGLSLGYCLRLFDGRIKIGASGKFINRVAINEDLDGNTSNATMATLAKEGGGVGWDGGILLTGPWKFLPTIGAVAHDIGTTKFSMTNGYFYSTSNRPPPQPQSIDAGIAVFPIIGKRSRMSIAAEYRDVQNPESTDMYRRIHGGMEFNFGDILFLRAGMNQRYYTAGLEFSLGFFQLQVATYGEEIGTPEKYREDRRFVGEFSIRF